MSGYAISRIREFLLDEVVDFVNKASALSGVHRIALLGSITTEKSEPKDVDVLVMVDDEMDLTDLARYGRQLAGHAQSRNKGADVFLTNTEGSYIGRTCHWKECRPGIRASCDAMHCGGRPYLHDDLGASIFRRPRWRTFRSICGRKSFGASSFPTTLKG